MKDLLGPFVRPTRAEKEPSPLGPWLVGFSPSRGTACATSLHNTTAREEGDHEETLRLIGGGTGYPLLIRCRRSSWPRVRSASPSRCG